MTTAPFLVILALQICLDRQGFSCNALDGEWGAKSAVALATYCAREGVAEPASPRAALEALFPGATNLFCEVEVTAADHAALTAIPKSPAAKAALPAMGYESIEEAFAEKGRLSRRALRRLNPQAAWPNPPAGTRVKLPHFPAPARRRGEAGPVADVLRVSLARREVTAFDAQGRLLALFPCSIAAKKNKLPPPGEIQVKTIVPRPNYLYTPDGAAAGAKNGRCVLPPGPNNPVGVAWVGLTLAGYGIHGTPYPEQIGRAESHGCFRLANWNAERLLKLCDVGTSVVIE